jgi:uncharacterized membrane protein
MSPALLVASLWALFLATHLVLSHPPVREPLRKRLGANGFSMAYSAVALAIFAPLAWTWWSHRGEGPTLWSLPGVTHGSELLVVIGLALTAGALARPAPSAVAARMIGLRTEVRGMTVYTRHPLFMGLSLVGIGHLLAFGQAVDVAWWGGLPLVTLVGSLHQDWRKLREDPDYAAFMANTTFLPVPSARSPGRTAIVGAIVGVAIAIGLRMFHPL